MNIFKNNYKIIESRFLSLAKKISGISPSTVGVASSKDNGICYAVKNNEVWSPITNPDNPIETAQNIINQNTDSIQIGFTPVIIAGLNPGYELDIIYNYFNSSSHKSDVFRRIYVIIFSPMRFIGWLNTQDRSEILNNTAIEFYWHEDISLLIDIFNKEINRSIYFSFVISLDTTLATKALTPILEFSKARLKETKILTDENEQYYKKISDNELAKIIKGEAGRKPRIMMPAHLASQVVQFSARDTLVAFEKIGWDTLFLGIERELSVFELVKTINDSKPDIVVNINHLRTEKGNLAAYPENLMYITWVQDQMPQLENSEAGNEWNKIAKKVNDENIEQRRDLIIGYAEGLHIYNYPNDRLKQMNMIVNTSKFKPVKISKAQLEKYGCDICFASNRGKDSVLTVKENLLSDISKFGWTEKVLMEVHDNIWSVYNDGKTLSDRASLITSLLNIVNFSDIYNDLSEVDKNETITRIQWVLNDLIYRHTVIGWCDEIGLNINLYGKDWDKHPKFAKYARGVIKHGDELNIAYQSAKYALHLNSVEGGHQRLFEIVSSGALPITRDSLHTSQLDVNLGSAFRKFASKCFYKKEIQMTNEEQAVFNDFIFIQSQQVLSSDLSIELPELEQQVQQKIIKHLMTHPNWLLDNWNSLLFNSKEDLQNIFNNNKNILHNSQIN